MKKNQSSHLPHYKIVTEHPFFEHFKEHVGQGLYSVLYNALSDLDQSVGAILVPLINLPTLAEIFGLQNGGNISNTTGITAPLRYLSTQGRTFEIDPGLNFLLEQTDIGNKAPGSAFKLPYNSIYLHLPKSTLKIVSSTDSTQFLYLSGMYINEVFDPGFELEARQKMGVSGPCRGFEFVFVSEGQKNEPLDSYFVHLRFVVPDAWADDPIETIVTKQMLTYAELGTSSDTRDHFADSMLELVCHLVKCLLFINSQDATLEEDNVHDDTVARLSRVKPAKQLKIKKQLKRAYNRITVTHTGAENDTPQAHYGNALNSSVRSHWRRGHFRQQAFGKGRINRKTLWIKPMLIHNDFNEIVEKTYKVKIKKKA